MLRSSATVLFIANNVLLFKVRFLRFVLNMAKIRCQLSDGIFSVLFIDGLIDHHVATVIIPGYFQIEFVLGKVGNVWFQLEVWEALSAASWTCFASATESGRVVLAC